MLALIANQYFKPIGNKSKISVLAARVYYSIWQFNSENLTNFSSSKLFIYVSSLISFLNHSIWSFLAQVMQILIRLAGLASTQNFWAETNSGCFGALILMDIHYVLVKI